MCIGRPFSEIQFKTASGFMSFPEMRLPAASLERLVGHPVSIRFAGLHIGVPFVVNNTLAGYVGFRFIQLRSVTLLLAASSNVTYCSGNSSLKSIHLRDYSRSLRQHTPRIVLRYNLATLSLDAVLLFRAQLTVGTLRTESSCG